MQLKTFKNQYDLIEFHHYIEQLDEESQVNILELSINIDNEDAESVESELESVFIIETEKQVYVFSNYEVSEYFDMGNGILQVVCVK